MISLCSVIIENGVDWSINLNHAGADAQKNRAGGEGPGAALLKDAAHN